MIHYVTSVSVPHRALRKEAERLVLKLGTGQAHLVRLKTVPHLQEAAEADKLLAEHAKGGHVVCASAAEIPLLRLLKTVGQGKLPPEELKVVVLTKDGRTVNLRVSDTGDFIDRWPEGFFSAREQELFY